MARNSNKPVEAPTDEVQADEAPVTESTETQVEDATPTETAAPAKVEYSLDEFQSAANSAVESSEYEAVQTAYGDLPRPGKTAATKWVNEQMVSALKDKGDKDLAVAWVGVQEALKSRTATKAASAPKAPANPTEGFIDRLAALSLAFTVANGNQPEGLDEDWTAKYDKRLAEISESGDLDKLLAHRNSTAEDKGDAPEVSDVVSRAVRIAFQGSTRKASSGGGSGTVYSGPRRSIGKHIAEAFASQPSGTFLSTGDLHNFKSSEYGDDSPSSGAISSALKSGKSLPEGITMTSGGPKNVVGAIKA